MGVCELPPGAITWVVPAYTYMGKTSYEGLTSQCIYVGRTSLVIWVCSFLLGRWGVGSTRSRSRTTVGIETDGNVEDVGYLLGVHRRVENVVETDKLGHGKQVLGKDSPKFVMCKISPELVSHLGVTSLWIHG